MGGKKKNLAYYLWSTASSIMLTSLFKETQSLSYFPLVADVAVQAWVCLGHGRESCCLLPSPATPWQTHRGSPQMQIDRVQTRCLKLADPRGSQQSHPMSAFSATAKSPKGATVSSLLGVPTQGTMKCEGFGFKRDRLQGKASAYIGIA